MEKTKSNACDVLVCGAGAAGLTLAIDLARRGISVRLIDKLDRPFAGSRGRGIMPRTQEIFEDLGVIDHLFTRGGDYPVQRIYEKDGSYRDEVRRVNIEPTSEEPYQRPLMVAQFLTEAVLRMKLLEHGVIPEYGTELTDFTQDSNDVTATLKTPQGNETLKVKYLIGCDGGKSFIRKHLSIEFPGQTLGLRILAADIKMPSLTREVGHEWNEGDMSAQIGIDPLHSTDLFCLRAVIPLEGDFDTSLEGIQSLVRERTGKDHKITEVAWASVFSMSARLAKSYRVKRIFLCGDAAHVHPPTGGQGLNTSVQDAYNLGWKMAKALKSGNDKILDSYEEERRPIAEGMLGLSTKILDAEKQGEGTNRGREVLQLDLNYRGSSITLDDNGNRRRTGGDRAPDAPFTTSAGMSKRLFDIYRGTHFTLLGYETTIDLPQQINLQSYRIAKDGEIIDAHATIALAYGLKKGDLVLIRPDGYIAAIEHESRKENLAKFIDNWC